ncbi:hypothetical protein Tco_0028861, partial [Tanacetum coccineum]
MVAAGWRWLWCCGGCDDDIDDDGGVTVVRRVEESGVGDRRDPEMELVFGVGRKIPPEKFSGDGAVTAAVAGGGGRPPV